MSTPALTLLAAFAGEVATNAAIPARQTETKVGLSVPSVFNPAAATFFTERHFPLIIVLPIAAAVEGRRRALSILLRWRVSTFAALIESCAGFARNEPA